MTLVCKISLRWNNPLSVFLPYSINSYLLSLKCIKSVYNLGAGPNITPFSRNTSVVLVLTPSLLELPFCKVPTFTNRKINYLLVIFT